MWIERACWLRLSAQELFPDAGRKLVRLRGGQRFTPICHAKQKRNKSGPARTGWQTPSTSCEGVELGSGSPWIKLAIDLMQYSTNVLILPALTWNARTCIIRSASALAGCSPGRSLVNQLPRRSATDA